MEISFAVSTERLDIKLSVLCGQVFRWRELPNGTILGIDGKNWYKITCHEDSATVTSNAPESDFRCMFRMSENWAEYDRIVREKAPELIPMMDELPGLRLLKPSSNVEVIFSFLCTSNNHLSRIYDMVEKLSCFGQPLIDGFHEFPRLDVIAGISESELRRLGFGYRGKTIPIAAQQILEKGGVEWLNSLQKIPFSLARASLIELAGVGPKLADCICLYGLGHTESVPVDTHIWQAGCRLWFPEFKNLPLTSKRYALVAEKLQSRLGPLAGWGHQFLFYENLLNWRSRKAN